MAGVTCAPPALTGEVEVLLRTSEDGQTWSRWYAVSLERVAEEGGEERAFSEPIWTGPGRYLQVGARQAGTGAAPERLRDVRVVAINSTEDADRAAVLAGVVRRAAATFAGLELAPPAAAMTRKPSIVTRTEWGANESWRSGSPSYAPVKMAFVHHTASGNGYSAAEAPAVVRGTYAYHTKSLQWSDVGYNFLVDRYGVIYEGRYGGVARGVIGAQVLGFNTGSTGHLRARHVQQRHTALRRDHVAGAVAGVEARRPPRRPAGHRVVGLRVRAEVRDRAARDVSGHRRSPRRQLHRVSRREALRAAAHHPQGRRAHRAAQDLRLHRRRSRDQPERRRRARPRDHRLHCLAGGDLGPGDPRRRRSSGAPGRRTGDRGRDDVGRQGRRRRALPDGVYTLQADATSAAGVARPATATVRLDTVAPARGERLLAPDPFSPNGDGQYDAATLAFVPGESGTARVSVIAADGTSLRRVTGWKAVTASTQKVRWDGRSRRARGSSRRPKARRSSCSSSATAPETKRARGARSQWTGHWRSRRFAQDVVSERRRRYDAVTLSFRLTRAADVTATVVQLRLHHQDDASRQAGAGRGRWSGTASSAAAARRRAARTRSGSRPTAPSVSPPSRRR